MYDPTETDLSYEYLLKLKERATNLRWALLGGWGTFFYVRKEFHRAFGIEYLKSRDIDIFIDSKDEIAFLKTINNLGFKESAYNFRYELIYDREKKKIIPLEQAKGKYIFNLIYLFLDVFSNKKTKKLGSWAFSSLEKARVDKIDEFPVLEINSLLDLKITSFFEREKLDKELKDACDIFALLIYSGRNIRINSRIKKAAKKIISRQDIKDYIAEHVLGDNLKSNLVMMMLKKFI